MSDAKPDDRTLSFAEATSFLDAIKAIDACQTCGKSQWFLFTDPEDHDLMLPFSLVGYRRDSPAGGPIKLVMGLECQNCGYIRLHSWNGVFKWLDANRGLSDG